MTSRLQADLNDRVRRMRAINEKLFADAEARAALERRLGVSLEPKRQPQRIRGMR